MSPEATSDHAALQRMYNVSDAVFGLALTLLVLDVRPPEGNTSAELIAGLQALIGPMIAFAGTFTVVSFFWLAHLSNLRRMIRFDWPTAVVNLVLLFCVALMPFASAMLGRNSRALVSWEIYAAANIATSLSQAALWMVVTRDGGRLLGGVGWRERYYRLMRGLSPGIAFAIGYLLAVKGRTDLVPLSPLLIIVVMVLARLIFGPKRLRQA